MRAAVFLAASIIVMGLYLAVAATIGVAGSLIALGMLAIAAAFAIGLVASATPNPPEI